MAKNLKQTLRDVFSGNHFDGKGGLTDLFRIEYKREYDNMRKSGIRVDDNMVKNYLNF